MPNSSKKSETSDLKTPTRDGPLNNSNSSVHSTPTGSAGRRRARKRRRIDKEGQSRRASVDSQLGECNIEDVKEIDRRLRKVARANAISSEDMHKVVRRVVRNEHVLALVTLKAEDELAREKREAEVQEEEEQQQRGAIIITDTPSVGKLTRAKARELNRTPGITLPPLNETPVNDEIEALIREDLHSDDEDEEYTFKEDDFHSDDDPNTTASDFDSNPCTPQTPMTANEDSPIKLTNDGCFKVPPDKHIDDPRIATRTRSKLCLQQTTIEDLQSEFVPPDVEQGDVLETTALDSEWMKFLNDFSKPLNNSFLGDDDDPINDPEYVAAEGVPVDAEELRDVNISKKEVTDLVSELFAGLLQEGVSLDSIELETPHKFLCEAQSQVVYANANPDPIEQVTRQIDFDAQPKLSAPAEANMSITTNAGLESFHPNVMSTPSTMGNNFVPVPIAETSVNNSQVDGCTVVNISGEILNQNMPELIAVPLPGQPNCFQLAKVVPPDQAPAELEYLSAQKPQSVNTTQEPYDINFSCKYLSIRKHIHSEYENQFESLRHVKPTPPAAPTNVKGFTQEQHDLLQQQLRIHTQMLTQSFLQTYSHPLLFSMAEKPKEMLLELQKKATKDASFNCWNLNGAVELIKKWEHDLSSDEYQEENQKMMKFINKETELTDGNTRQVPRLAPRIMDLMLDSQVFMYPQYLPRMAFQSKKVQFTAYAPSEYQLIAMGLEKHLTAIKMAKKPLRKGADPLRIACKRMARDTIHGKEYRRIFFKVNELFEMQQYNPIKYYFEHNRAPPVNQYIWGFENGVVPTPREQYHLLANGWKYYIEKNWNNDKRVRRSSKQSHVQASAAASASFLQFVREAVGEELLLPDSLGEASAPHGSATGHLSLGKTEETSTTKKPEPKTAQRKRRPRTTASSSLTINVNYVFGGQISPSQGGAGVSVPLLPVPYADNVVSLNRTLTTSDECDLLALPPPQPPLADDAPPAVNFSFNPATETLEIKELPESVEQTEEINHQERITSTTKPARNAFKPRILSAHQRRLRGTGSRLRPYPVLRQRLRHKLRKRCKSLILCYGNYLRKQRDQYAHVQPVQFYHIRFLALDLYTQLLVDLRVFCQKMEGIETPQLTEPAVASLPAQKPQPSKAPQQKRQRCEEAARNRRAMRMEEMQRHMLQPDTPEERNRKDATFAFNFYDKVEEALLKANRLEDCQKFNQLLQTFDPKQDKVSDLYLKVEKLLLPDLPELAEVFLNFLLPAEAAELGKFFEYFMITNASNFINKLNIYFCKQPAQIRKIYACLSELAALPSVSMKKVESKIMPLLKDNPFLCDWFVQQFPQAKPPQRLLPPAEPINLHEVSSNPNVDSAETITELMDDPPTQGKQPACQIKYFNGRIYYGTKIMLPAKLSFRAASIYNEQSHDDIVDGEKITCAHGIRAQGEKLINCASSVDSDDAAERSEEDDASRALLIDTTTGEDENSSSSLDICDDATLRSHAIRLNASYYNNCLINATTSTPNMGPHHAHHHPNAKKTAINFGEVSPRRQSAANVSPQSGLSPLPALASTSLGASPQQDKRKSPSKKVRSPLGQTQARPRYNVQPMVVIHEPPSRNSSAAVSPAIECAKRLRTLIDQEEPDNKAGIQIIAQAKLSPLPQASPAPPSVAKSEEDQEFLPINSSDERNDSISLTQQSFPAIKMDISSDEMEVQPQSGPGNTPQHVITTQFDSDEDCKLDVVATLANCAEEQREEMPGTSRAMAAPPAPTPVAPTPPASSAWTRDEDKVILIEMKRGARDRQHLIRRIGEKLMHRKEHELRARHQFLMDFLSKLQGK